MKTMTKVATAAGIAALVILILQKKSGGNGVPPGASFDVGIGLSGLDWNGSNFEQGGSGHGAYVVDDNAPDYHMCPIEDYNYFVSAKKMPLVRIQFRWERVQHWPLGALDPFDIGLVDTQLSYAESVGAKAILTPMNYGRYGRGGGFAPYTLGSASLPVSSMANFWGLLAQHYKDNPTVYGYELMNEPYRLGANESEGMAIWFQACQVAINAIRAVDPNTLIIVPGYSWQEAHTWPIYSDNLKNLVDPSNRMIYAAHQYLDPINVDEYHNSSWVDYNGVSRSADRLLPDSQWVGLPSGHTSLTIGPDRLKPFTDWLRINGKKGIITEMGVPAYKDLSYWVGGVFTAQPDDPASTTFWADRFAKTIEFMLANTDVLFGVTFHVGGRGWTSLSRVAYSEAIEPIITGGWHGTYGADRPQMTVIQSYMS